MSIVFASAAAQQQVRGCRTVCDFFLASLSIPAKPAECADEVVEKRWKASSYSKLKADSRFKLDHVCFYSFFRLNRMSPEE